MGLSNPIVVAGEYVAGAVAVPLNVDVNGFLNVNASFSGSISGNAAAGPTGLVVPSNADFLGLNIGGVLAGLTGVALTNANAATVAIVDGSGNQITSFGGGVQFPDNAASGATPTGTLIMGWDSVNSKIRAFKVDPSQNLLVAGSLNIGSFGGTTVTIGQQLMSASIPIAIASNQTSIPVTLASTTISSTVAVTQSTSPWVENMSQFGGTNVTIGQKTSAASIPVVIANDQSSLAFDPQGPDAQGAAQTGKPLQNGGLYYTDGTVRTFATDVNGVQLMSIVGGSFTLNTTSPLTGGGTISNGGTLTFACPTCITSGFSNPMTTLGDIIYGASGGTPTRLGIGGANTLLHGGTTPTYSAVIQGDVTNGYVDLSTTQAAIGGNKNFTGTNTNKSVDAIVYVDIGNPQGWAGSDVGAWINSAYAALPANGGTIVVAASASTYTQTTPIVFGTSGKPALLSCSPGGAVTLNYTPTTGAAFTYNVGGTISGPNHLFHGGISGCYLLGPGNATTATALVLGGTNGAEGFSFSDGAKIWLFGTGVLIGNNTFWTEFRHSLIGNNGTSFNYPGGLTNAGETMQFIDMVFQGSDAIYTNCVQLNGSGGSTGGFIFSGGSMDDCQFVQSAGLTTMNHVHIENPGQGAVSKANPFVIVSGTAVLSMTDCEIVQDAASGVTSTSLIAHSGTALTLHGGGYTTAQTITNLVSITGNVYFSFIGAPFMGAFTNPYVVVSGSPQITDLRPGFSQLQGAPIGGGPAAALVGRVLQPNSTTNALKVYGTDGAGVARWAQVFSDGSDAWFSGNAVNTPTSGLHFNMNTGLAELIAAGANSNVNITSTGTGIMNVTGGGSVFNGFANKFGQASIIADSAAINTTDTVIVKTPALPANRLIAGSVIRIILDGICTSTVANISTFTIRWGTLGTTGDGTVAAVATSVAAASGSANPFRTELLLTIRTAGASATSDVTGYLTSQGNIGIVATPNAFFVAGTTFNTTTASGILSVSYKSAASTTTSTFKNAFIEIVYQ